MKKISEESIKILLEIEELNEKLLDLADKFDRSIEEVAKCKYVVYDGSIHKLRCGNIHAEFNENSEMTFSIYTEDREFDGPLDNSDESIEMLKDLRFFSKLKDAKEYLVSIKK